MALSYSDMQFWVCLLQGLDLDIPSHWRREPVSLEEVFTYLDAHVPIRFTYIRDYSEVMVDIGWEHRAFVIPTPKSTTMLDAYIDHQELTTAELCAITEYVQQNKRLRDIFWDREYFSRYAVHDVFREYSFFTRRPDLPVRLDVCLPAAIPYSDLRDFFAYFSMFVGADALFVPSENIQDAVDYLRKYRGRDITIHCDTRTLTNSYLSLNCAAFSERLFEFFVKTF